VTPASVSPATSPRSIAPGCADVGLVEVGVLAVDGTKLAASASNHATRSYEQIATQILAEAGRIDRAEDEIHGEARGDELPEHLASREGRRAWLRQAKERLERERAAKQEPVPRERQKRLELCHDRLVEDWRTERQANRAYEAYRARGVKGPCRSSDGAGFTPWGPVPAHLCATASARSSSAPHSLSAPSPRRHAGNAKTPMDSRLAPKSAQELAGLCRQAAKRLADRLESGAQLPISRFDRQHRVLKTRERAIGLADGLDRALDEGGGTLRGESRRLLLEDGGLEPVAAGELGVGALRAAVGDLHRPKALVLESVAAVLVQLLVGLGQARAGEPELVCRPCDGVQQLLPRL
jgi:hypothetical protein